MDPIQSRRRHLAKAITWRVIASISVFSVTYLLTGKIKEAGYVMLVDGVIKMVLYYYHERVWFRYGSLGRKKDDE